MKVAKSRAFKDRLKGHKESVIALYSPYGDDGHMLYSVSRDGSMRGWDLAKREITLKLLLDRTMNTIEEKDKEKEEQQKDMEMKEDKKQMENKGPVRQQIICGAFTEKYLFGSYEDGTIIQWAFNKGEIVRELLGHTKRVSHIAYIEEKKIIVTSSYDATIRTWNVETGQNITVYKTSGPIHNLRIGDDLCIQAIINRNIFYEIDTQNNSILKCIKFNKHSITSFFYKENTLIFGNIENKVLIYDLTNFDPENADKLEPKRIIEGLGGWSLCFEFNRDYLYMGSDDRKIRVYKWPEMKEVEELAGHDDGIFCLCFADRMLYSGSFDHSIRSWDVREMVQRIAERQGMEFEDIESKKYEVYYGVVFKNKKKKLAKKKKT